MGEFTPEKLVVSWDIEKTLMAIGRHYAGSFDELAVFDRALTEGEVQELYTLDLGKVL